MEWCKENAPEVLTKRIQGDGVYIDHSVYNFDTLRSLLQAERGFLEALDGATDKDAFLGPFVMRPRRVLSFNPTQADVEELIEAMPEPAPKKARLPEELITKFILATEFVDGNSEPRRCPCQGITYEQLAEAAKATIREGIANALKAVLRERDEEAERKKREQDDAPERGED